MNLSGVPLTLAEARRMSSVDLVMAFEIAMNDMNTRAALNQHDADVDRLTRELRGSYRG